MLIWNPLSPACLACHHPAEASSAPFCRSCLDSLVPSWSPIPGDGSSDPVYSWTALYLAIGRSYDVLRAWKKRTSPLADRWILNPSQPALQSLAQSGAHALVPIPQGVARAWRLGRSPARQLCLWMSHRLELPMSECLAIEPRARSQASLTLDQRLQRKTPFRLANPQTRELVGRRILLVDDFVTSGRTVRGVAALLRRAGAADVQVACLGLRPGPSSLRRSS